ncbi:SH3 domain-containing protein [Marivirga harenae]|uniref:SH3 domain-containing protein n=1 Tax=Marivirga harenae TaxID=2010992 RepID=UPI0026DFF7F0|nr:SH3 domain-containing protein [Marivirga harenae]WKV11823.1 SH3 domain-containing protein [Marivirga harenae]
MKIFFQSLILGCFLLCLPATAQEVGYINDPDGYTNIREGQSSDTEIIARFVTGERFLYYPAANSSWWKVVKKISRNKTVEGYVHKSRIQPIYHSDGNSNIGLKRIYHEFDRTASSFRTSKRDIGTSNLPQYYFIETIDEQGRVIDLKFMENGRIINNHLCYLSPWMKFEYPNQTTIIQYNLNADGSKLSEIECEMWYKTTYTINEEQNKILNTEIEFSIDSTSLLNDYGWTKDELYPILENLEDKNYNARTITGYLKSTAKLDGKFPIGEECILKHYDYLGLEYEELKQLME